MTRGPSVHFAYVRRPTHLPQPWGRIPGLNVVSTSVFHNRYHLERVRNLGFYMVIWDRLFGTLAPAREK
ncbi:MAG TPA: hypothetical protein VFC90_12085 [Planctomycetota bacterium]|nr:hypothetical protein [Planctomycetota bacterium]